MHFSYTGGSTFAGLCDLSQQMSALLKHEQWPAA